ncbi:MAG: hypothetical protein HF973_10060 [Chloroflexi bacterium]|nr:hypothetical protein [Chloroflexota bacterium]
MARKLLLFVGIVMGAALLGTAVDVYLFSRKDVDCAADAAIVLGAGVFGERPYHMRRASAIADKLGMNACSSPTRTTQWINGFTQFQAFAREVIAYLVYLLAEIFGLYEI